jgi:hypothetical protein
MSDLRAYLDDIALRRGVLTPVVVVEEASSESHPLHDRFEWDDSIAGHEYRVIQAGYLIRSVKVVVGDERVNAYVSLPVRVEVKSISDPKREYVAVDHLSPDQYQSHLQSMRLEIAILRKKYGAYKEFREEILSVLEGAA